MGVGLVGVGALLEQEQRDRHVAHSGARVQRRAAALVGAIDVERASPAGEQHHNGTHVFTLDGTDQLVNQQCRAAVAGARPPARHCWRCSRRRPYCGGRDHCLRSRAIAGARRCGRAQHGEQLLTHGRGVRAGAEAAGRGGYGRRGRREATEARPVGTSHSCPDPQAPAARGEASGAARWNRQDGGRPADAAAPPQPGERVPVVAAGEEVPRVGVEGLGACEPGWRVCTDRHQDANTRRACVRPGSTDKGVSVRVL